jgi:hypothetical protein
MALGRARPNGTAHRSRPRRASTPLERARCHPGWAAHAMHLPGDIAVRPERLDVARGGTRYRRALAHAEARSLRPLAAHGHLGGSSPARIGERDPAAEHADRAAALYRAMGIGARTSPSRARHHHPVMIPALRAFRGAAVRGRLRASPRGPTSASSRRPAGRASGAASAECAVSSRPRHGEARWGAPCGWRGPLCRLRRARGEQARHPDMKMEIEAAVGLPA